MPHKKLQQPNGYPLPEKFLDVVKTRNRIEAIKNTIANLEKDRSRKSVLPKLKFNFYIRHIDSIEAAFKILFRVKAKGIAETPDSLMFADCANIMEDYEKAFETLAENDAQIEYQIFTDNVAVSARASRNNRAASRIRVSKFTGEINNTQIIIKAFENKKRSKGLTRPEQLRYATKIKLLEKLVKGLAKK